MHAKTLSREICRNQLSPAALSAILVYYLRYQDACETGIMYNSSSSSSSSSSFVAVCRKSSHIAGASKPPPLLLPRD
jgi:hypothetical protein